MTPTRTTRTPTPTTPTASTSSSVRVGVAVARCVDPVDVETFLAEHWERGPLHVARADPSRFDDLLSLREAERLLTSTGLRFPAFRLVKAGEQIPLAAYTEDVSWRPRPFTGTAHVRRVLQEFERGATVVLQGLHLNHAEVAAFTRRLETELGHSVQANAYYTPRAAQGLPVHHDTHDVFVLQAAGEKRWLVYEPVVELPLRGQRYAPDLGGPGEIVLDVTLRAGDTLYLPRGWLHEALTSDADSLHLTVGVNVYTRMEALRAALEECAEDVAFRRSVAADGELDADLLDRLAGRLGAEAVARRREDRLARLRRPLLPDGFDQVRALRALDAATAVELRPTAAPTLAADGRTATVSFNGLEVRFPARARSALEAACAADGPFSSSELPGPLDEAGRLVLVRRLVREGLLRILPAGRPT